MPHVFVLTPRIHRSREQKGWSNSCAGCGDDIRLRSRVVSVGGPGNPIYDMICALSNGLVRPS